MHMRSPHTDPSWHPKTVERYAPRGPKNQATYDYEKLMQLPDAVLERMKGDDVPEHDEKLVRGYWTYVTAHREWLMQERANERKAKALAAAALALETTDIEGME